MEPLTVETDGGAPVCVAGNSMTNSDKISEKLHKNCSKLPQNLNKTRNQVNTYREEEGSTNFDEEMALNCRLMVEIHLNLGIIAEEMLFMYFAVHELGHHHSSG